MLVCKKAFEPGRAVRAVGVAGAARSVTLDHFRDLFGRRGGHGELLFLRHALNSLIAAVATTVVGVAAVVHRGVRASRGSGSRAARPG